MRSKSQQDGLGILSYLSPQKKQMLFQLYTFHMAAKPIIVHQFSLDSAPSPANAELQTYCFWEGQRGQLCSSVMSANRCLHVVKLRFWKYGHVYVPLLQGAAAKGDNCIHAYLSFPHAVAGSGPYYFLPD